MLSQYDIELLMDANLRQSRLIAEISAVFVPVMGCSSPHQNSTEQQLDKIRKLIGEYSS